MSTHPLEIHSLQKSFGGVHAVRGATFAVEAHKITALIGPNGAGKTTVFNLINGFFAPDAGRITFREEDITSLSLDARSRRGMSRTFQFARSFRNMTVRENLLLSARTYDDRFWEMLLRPQADAQFDQRIREVLAFVGLRKDTAARITDLSYGEQKLFDLARAILNPHTLLLLDEPVAGVNPVIRKELGDILRRLKSEGETILLIEHDMDFVRTVADHMIVLDQGSVLAEGTPSVVLHDQRVLDAYLGPHYTSSHAA